MSVVYSHRVRYHEVDQQGFMFNGRFLEIADVAMVEVFRGLGWHYEDLIAGGTDPSGDSVLVDGRPGGIWRSRAPVRRPWSFAGRRWKDRV